MDGGSFHHALRVEPNKQHAHESSLLLQRKIMALGGGKGGVGKTVLTAAMGIALAEAGKTAVVVDVDFGGANLHQALGILNPPVTIRDFIDGKERDLNNLVLETSVPNLYLLAGASGSIELANLTFAQKQKVLRHLRDIKADYIFLDLGAGGAYNQLDYFLAADECILVVTPDPISIQDSYNFLKLSLFRRLYRLFKKNEQVLAELKSLLSRPAATHASSMRELTSRMGRYGQSILSLWQQAIQSFRPRIIVNMMESEEDQKECWTIRIAAREILNVHIRSYSYIRYDDDFRKAVKRMQPNMLLSESDLASNDIRKIVSDLFLEGKMQVPMNVKNCESKIYLREKPPSLKENDIICSVRCNLWGNCSVQNGGYPCRVKVIGHINQHKSMAM